MITSCQKTTDHNTENDAVVKIRKGVMRHRGERIGTCKTQVAENLERLTQTRMHISNHSIAINEKATNTSLLILTAKKVKSI